jgi:hypothetical protein
MEGTVGPIPWAILIRNLKRGFKLLAHCRQLLGYYMAVSSFRFRGLIVRHLLLLLFFCVFMFPARASEDQSLGDISTGNGFLRTCSAIDKMENGEMSKSEMVFVASCSGYLEGLGAGTSLAAATAAAKGNPEILDNIAFCIPDGVNFGQEVRGVLKFIRENPEKAHLPTGFLATTALKRAFPC